MPKEEKKAALSLARLVAPGEDAGVNEDGGVLWNRKRTMKWDRVKGKWDACAPPNCAERAGDTVRDFSSAFYTPAFRWLWVQNFIASIGGTFSGYFFFYWMQDTFTEGFWLFNRWEVASNVQSAGENAHAVTLSPTVTIILASFVPLSVSMFHDCSLTSVSAAQY